MHKELFNRSQDCNNIFILFSAVAKLLIYFKLFQTVLKTRRLFFHRLWLRTNKGCDQIIMIMDLRLQEQHHFITFGI